MINLSPAAYESGSNDNVRLKTLIIPNWLAKAETVFSKDKLWELFYFYGGRKNCKCFSGFVCPGASCTRSTLFYSESAPNCLCNIGSTYTCRKKEIIGRVRRCEYEGYLWFMLLFRQLMVFVTAMTMVVDI